MHVTKGLEKRAPGSVGRLQGGMCLRCVSVFHDIVEFKFFGIEDADRL